MRDARQEDVVEIVEHGGERLRVLGRGRWQLRADLARCDLGQHGQLADALEIAGGPFERGGAVGPQVGLFGASRLGTHVGHAALPAAANA